MPMHFIQFYWEQEMTRVKKFACTSPAQIQGNNECKSFGSLLEMFDSTKVFIIAIYIFPYASTTCSATFHAAIHFKTGRFRAGNKSSFLVLNSFISGQCSLDLLWTFFFQNYVYNPLCRSRYITAFYSFTIGSHSLPDESP